MSNHHDTHAPDDPGETRTEPAAPEPSQEVLLADNARLAADLLAAESQLAAVQAENVRVTGEWEESVKREEESAELSGSYHAEAVRIREEVVVVRTLLSRIVRYAHEDRARTPGVTRLARVLLEAEKLLTAAPGPGAGEKT